MTDGKASGHARVLLVEDHESMREILAMYLATEEGVEVVGAAASAEEALETIDAARPDLLLIDVSMPGMSGIDMARVVSERWPWLPCVMLSGHSEGRYVQQALSAGARGYILKGFPEQLGPAIRAVLGGGVYVSEQARPVPATE